MSNVPQSRAMRSAGCIGRGREVTAADTGVGQERAGERNDEHEARSLETVTQKKPHKSAGHFKNPAHARAQGVTRVAHGAAEGNSMPFAWRKARSRAKKEKRRARPLSFCVSLRPFLSTPVLQVRRRSKPQHISVRHSLHCWSREEASY